MKYWQGAPREGVNPSLPEIYYIINIYSRKIIYFYYGNSNRTIISIVRQYFNIIRAIMLRAGLAFGAKPASPSNWCSRCLSILVLEHPQHPWAWSLSCSSLLRLEHRWAIGSRDFIALSHASLNTLVLSDFPIRIFLLAFYKVARIQTNN
jgi:hypothetical protein